MRGWWLLLAGPALGCGRVETAGDAVVVSYQWAGIAAFAGLGLALLGGAFALLPGIRSLVERRIGLRGKIRTAVALIGLVPIGGMALLVAASWASYRVEIGARGIRASGLALRGSWSWDDVETLEWRRGNARRLFLRFRDGRQHFINEATVGGEAFDELVRGVERLRPAVDGAE